MLQQFSTLLQIKIPFLRRSLKVHANQSPLLNNGCRLANREKDASPKHKPTPRTSNRRQLATPYLSIASAATEARARANLSLRSFATYSHHLPCGDLLSRGTYIQFDIPTLAIKAAIAPSPPQPMRVLEPLHSIHRAMMRHLVSSPQRSHEHLNFKSVCSSHVPYWRIASRRFASAVITAVRTYPSAPLIEHFVNGLYPPRHRT